MRVDEITNDSRKVIKRLSTAYIAYVTDNSKYDDLWQELQSCSTSKDPIIAFEAKRITAILNDQLLSILTNN